MSRQKSQDKSQSQPFVDKFQTQLEQCTTQQAALLRGRLRGLSKIKNDQRQQQVLERIAADIETAELAYLERQQQKFNISYPEELPVAQQRGDIKKAIEQNQVVVIAGETGSGKTTQLPKMLLELGYGRKGTIGHTQPRRLAARSVAARIGDELQRSREKAGGL